MPSLVAPVLLAGSLAKHAQPELTDGVVRLRHWRDDDVPAVLAAYSDPAIQLWHARSMTPDEAVAWVRAWPERWQREDGAGWAIELDGDVVGQISLRRIQLVDAWAEISYWVLPAGRGRGIAPAALELLTEWAFTQVGILRLSLDHSTRNLPSCRVATKSGYQLEGTARRQLLHPDGWHDMHQHARLNPALDDPA